MWCCIYVSVSPPTLKVFLVFMNRLSGMFSFPPSVVFFNHAGSVAQGIAASICWSAPPFWSDRKKYINKCLMNFHGTLNRHSWCPEGKPRALVDQFNFCPGRQNSKGTTHSCMKTHLLSTHTAQNLAFSVDTGRANMQVSVFAEENSEFLTKFWVRITGIHTRVHTHRKKGEAHSENIWKGTGQTFFLSPSKWSKTATVLGFL